MVTIASPVVIIHEHSIASSCETDCEFAPHETGRAEAVNEDDLRWGVRGGYRALSPPSTPTFSPS